MALMQAMASVRPPAPIRWAGGGLGGGDGRDRFPVAKNRLDGQRLGLVAQLGGGAVGVDVADVGGLHAGAGQGTLHAGGSACAVGAGVR